MKLGPLPLLICLARLSVMVVVGAGAAWGADSAEAAAAKQRNSSSAEVASPELSLVVNADDPAFSATVLAPRLSMELKQPVVPLPRDAPQAGLGVITMTWRPSRSELAVTFHDEARGVVSRVVAAPLNLDEALRAAVWLASNVVRDDVSDLLGPAPAATKVHAQNDVAPATLPPPVAAAEESPAPPPRAYKFVTLSLIHPLATNGNDPNVRTRLNLNLISGYVGQLDGLQLGGFGVVDADVSGGQISMVGSLAGGSVEGFQVATLFNVANGNFKGLQLSLGMNLVARGRGPSPSRRGNQLNLRGLQVALGLNYASGDVVGGQVAAVNVAGNVDGVQLGLVNVAKQVNGLQLGLINVADDIKGLPIGLVSVTKSGGVHPMLWFSSQSALNLGIKFATRYTYTAVTVSRGSDRGRMQIGPGYLLGAHVPLGWLSFDTDIGATYMFGGEVCCVSSSVGLADDRLLARWRALFGIQSSGGRGVFLGTGATVAVRFRQGISTDTTASLHPDFFIGITL